ncbi:phospholipase D-like domain-containing protein [Sorangium sp. So ce367]|uniref:phospholipase D-like domain-containing protein n=1 Tax=Sorangium sp. So ce367 TaxID=3133305 RepID=UPI003F600FD0
MPIRNYTRTIRDLASGLMGGPTRRDDQSRPDTQWVRTAHFESDTLATFVVPGDWPESTDDWFLPQTRTYPQRDRSSFEYYIDGTETYDAMLEAIETAHGPEHFIILVGWTMHLDFALLRDRGARTSLHGQTGEAILRAKVEQGVKLRVLIYNNPTPTDWFAVGSSKRAVDSFNAGATASPPGAICIVDENVRLLGSHHQKILVVYGREGLVAFYGGVDLSPDRVGVTRVVGVYDPGTPMHDVHARVTGDAALDLLRLVVLRWNHARWDDFGPLMMVPLPGTVPIPVPLGKREVYGRELEDLSQWLRQAESLPVTSSAVCYPTRIGQTIGNPDIAQLPDQHSDAWEYIRHAIRRAQRFIYIEDQYFWSLAAVDVLVEALGHIDQLTILLPRVDTINENLRHQAMHRLLTRAAEARTKIGIYTRLGTYHSYIHAKLFIVDDQVAIIGSANCNNRGYEYDSEVVGITCDPTWQTASGPRHGAWHVLELDAAHKLRMELWSEHLNMPYTERLYDGVASTVYWRRPARTANIQVYHIDGRPWYEALENWNPLATSAADFAIDPALPRAAGGTSGAHAAGDAAAGDTSGAP